MIRSNQVEMCSPGAGTEKNVCDRNDAKITSFLPFLLVYYFFFGV